MSRLIYDVLEFQRDSVSECLRDCVQHYLPVVPTRELLGRINELFSICEKNTQKKLSSVLAKDKNLGIFEHEIPENSTMLAELNFSHPEDDWSLMAKEDLGRMFWDKYICTDAPATPEERFDRLILDFYSNTEFIFADAGEEIVETIADRIRKDRTLDIKELYPLDYINNEENPKNVIDDIAYNKATGKLSPTEEKILMRLNEAYSNIDIEELLDNAVEYWEDILKDEPNIDK